MISFKIKCYKTCTEHVLLKVIVAFVAVLFGCVGTGRYWGGLFICFAFTEQYLVHFFTLQKTIANEKVIKSTYLDIFKLLCVSSTKIILVCKWFLNTGHRFCVCKSATNVTLHKCSSCKRISIWYDDMNKEYNIVLEIFYRYKSCFNWNPWHLLNHN